MEARAPLLVWPTVEEAVVVAAATLEQKSASPPKERRFSWLRDALWRERVVVGEEGVVMQGLGW